MGDPERIGALAGIGHTPIVRLSALPGADDAEVWVKLEAANPTGSYKDRMALAMIEGAERSGRLRPGQTVIEYTGGSTGSSLAFVCSVKGYPLRIVSSTAFSEEKLRTMEVFGAEIDIIDSPDGITPDLVPRMMARAAEIVAETGGFPTDQFNNRDALDGYREIGEEIVAQLGDGSVDAFCAYVGVGGCFLGATTALRQRWPEMLRVTVEPEESAVMSGGLAGTHHIEGGGVGFIPPLLEDGGWDEVIAVSTADAGDMARKAARREGIWTGRSGGANLTAALRLAHRLGGDHRVVTVQPDSGLKYLNGDMYR
jgi:cysteine synthase